MSFAATVPVSEMDTANTALELAGFGSNNFTVPVRTNGSSGDATKVLLLCIGNNPAFRAAVAALPNVVLGDYGTLVDCYADFKAVQNYDPADAVNWFQNPIMTGDQRVYGGKTWESLIDYNVWTPPVAWREVVATGYPAWVQPTGAHDAYALGAMVTFNGQNWRSTTPANVWQPGVFGWEVVP